MEPTKSSVIGLTKENVGEITYLTEDLTREVTQLEDALDMLVSKLQPVLASETDDAGVDPNPRPIPMSPYGQTLDQLLNRINAINYRVNNLRKRAQL